MGSGRDEDDIQEPASPPALKLDARLKGVLSGEALGRQQLVVHRIPSGPGGNHSEILGYANLTSHPFDPHTLLLSGPSHPSLQLVETPYEGDVAELDTLAVEYLEVNDTILHALFDMILPYHPDIHTVRIGEGCTRVADSTKKPAIKAASSVHTLVIGDLQDGNTPAVRDTFHIAFLTLAQNPDLTKLCLVGAGALQPEYSQLSRYWKELFVSVRLLPATFFRSVQYKFETSDRLVIRQANIAWEHVHMCFESGRIYAGDLDKLSHIQAKQAGWGSTANLRFWPSWVRGLRWGKDSQLIFEGLPNKGGMLRGLTFEKEVERVIQLGGGATPTILFESV